jgi:hypothetical protein
MSPYSGIERQVACTWTDVSEECVTSIFKVDNQPSEEQACSRWLGDTFLWNVGSRKDYKVLYPRGWHHWNKSRFKAASVRCFSLEHRSSVLPWNMCALLSAHMTSGVKGHHSSNIHLSLLQVGDWEKHFSAWERYLVVYVGAYAMWIIGKRLKKRWVIGCDCHKK